MSTFPYLVNESFYKADGSKYPDSTIVYGAKNNDGTDVKELQVGVLTNETSSISETALRSYRGFNPGGGDIIYADDFVASATDVTSGKSQYKDTITLTGLKSGDFVMFAMVSDSALSNPSITATNAGTISSVIQAHTNNNPGHAIFYFFVNDTSTVITPNFTNTPYWTPNNLAVAFRGVSSSNPLDLTQTSCTSSSGSPNPPSITTVTNNSLIVIFGFLDDRDIADNSGNPLIAPSGYTSVGSNFDNTTRSPSTGGGNASVMIATKLQSTAGTENPGAFQGSSDENVAFTFALRSISNSSSNVYPDSQKRFFFVRPNTDIYGLITNKITPIYLDISGNTLATLGMTSAGVSTDYKFYDTGTLTVSLTSQDSSNAPSDIDTGTSFQWYYSTVENQRGYLSQEGLISYPITGQTTKNYTPSASGTPGSTAKSVRCGVTYASGAKTVYSQWTPTNTYYYALATTTGAPVLAPGNSGSFILSGYVGTPETLYYSIDPLPGYSLSGSDFSNGSLNGTLSVSDGNVAIPVRTTNASLGKLFNVNIRKNSTSGTIVGTSSSITSDFKSPGNAAPSLGRTFKTSGSYSTSAAGWAGSGWQSIFSGVPNSSNQGLNNISAEVALGFDFKIDGNTYTSVYVTNHAWLQFGTGASTTSAAGSGVVRFKIGIDDQTQNNQDRSLSYIVRAAKLVKSDFVTLRLEWGTGYNKTFNSARSETGTDYGYMCAEVTFVKGDKYGVPIIEIRVGQAAFASSHGSWNSDFTWSLLSDTGSTTLADYGTSQDTSTVLVANDANGNSWTSHSASSLILPESYSLSGYSNATEGSISYFFLSTSNVNNGTTLYYDIVAGDSGNTPTAADFEGITSLTGNSFTTTNNFTFIILYPKNDGTASENETFKLKITDLPGSLGSQLAISNSVTLVDGGSVSHSVSPSATSVSEGGSITFTVNTSNVVETTPLYYTIDSDTNGTLYGSSSDFTSSLSGLIGNVSSNTVSKAITVATDSLYESDETFYFSVRTDSTSGTIVARSSQITITGSSISISATNTHLINSQKTFTINTSGVTGTLYYFITSNSAGDSTTGITASDFQNNIISGSFTAGNNVTITLSNTASANRPYYLAIKTDNSLSATTRAISSQITPASATFDSLTVDTQQPYVGGNVVFTLATTNVPNGTTLDYFITSNSSGTQQSGGSFVEASDFSPASLTGTFNTTNNSTTITLTHSSTGTANEQYYLAVKSDGASLSDTALAVSPLITLQAIPTPVLHESDGKTVYQGRRINAPANVSVGDLLIMTASNPNTSSSDLYDNTTYTVRKSNGTADGWTLAFTDGSGVADANGAVFYKVATSDDVTKSQYHTSSDNFYKYDVYASVNRGRQGLMCHRLTNASSISILGTSTDDSSGNSVTLSSLTTTRINSLLLFHIAYQDQKNAITLSSSTGWTWGDSNSTDPRSTGDKLRTYSGSYSSSVMGYKEIASPGAVGNLTVNASGDSIDGGVGRLFVIT